MFGQGVLYGVNARRSHGPHFEKWGINEGCMSLSIAFSLFWPLPIKGARKSKIKYITDKILDYIYKFGWTE